MRVLGVGERSARAGEPDRHPSGAGIARRRWLTSLSFVDALGVLDLNRLAARRSARASHFVVVVIGAATAGGSSLHVNATRWLRFGLTGGYRVATAVDDFDYGGDSMGGVVVGGNIEFGWF